jgi:ATP-dependent Lon protease
MPKDGPSAGITIATALVSSLTGIPIRRDLSMTGEITLRGRVLPIGGLKEKALAAHRGEMKKVLYPADNARDLDDIPKSIRSELELVAVSHVDEVLRHALVLEDPEAFFLRLKGERAVRETISANPSVQH